MSCETKQDANHQTEYILDENALKVIKNFLENISKVSGIHNSDTVEIKTNYNRADSEVVIEGKSNSLIILGRDRDAGVASGKGGIGSTGASCIDLVAGHMGSRPIEKLYGENIQSDKDFKNDSARIYISQKSNIDEYFDIPKINVKLGNTSIPLEDSNNKSAVASKADVVRLIGRENIKLVTFHKGLNSQSKKTSDGGIDIIAGCNALNSDKTLSVQPMVKGNNLVQLLKEMIKMIEDVQSTVASFMEKQKKINDILANHVHQSNGAGLPTNTPAGPNGSFANYKLLSKTLPDILKNFITHASIDGSYFNASSDKYINSLWNRVN